ncbi:MAG: hypothetical protein H6605_05350 [Flavobacteriales bacterium]|nr:hypothetical protein [Flavobacteriales bacterium]
MYDLISGKVNYVTYQKGYEDQFIQRYQYDADNRITEVLSSVDGRHWDRDARYNYYMHGPLSRTEIGQLMVQGLDYAYTLHGWLKGVNSATLNPDRDPGHDGVSFSTSGIHANVAKDVMGFNLGYYSTDYEPISDSRSIPIPTANKFLPSISGSGYSAAAPSLYNGNIRMMHTGLKPIIDGTSQHMAMAYTYDQLNRISTANAWDNYNNTTNEWQSSGTALTAYAEEFEYDPNGNILTLNRNGGTGLSSPPPSSTNMDNLTYHYYSGTNQLEYVSDNVTYTGNYSNDIDNQSSGNYSYDAIGNLISDVSEDIQTIEWTVYGKIKSITRGTPGVNNPNLEFTYSPDGHRTSKKVIVPGGDTKTTYYICDAQGNQMATYTILNEDPIVWEGSPIYGSSRIGIFEPNMELSEDSDPNDDSHISTWLQALPQNYLEYEVYRGLRKYELSNHLGNVLAVISDKRSSVCVSGDIDHYEADVLQATDYYSGGMSIVGRMWSSGSAEKYRFGFNGKEKDDETLTQDYGFRIYNPSLGRFLSVDPLTREYPWYSPYHFAGNMPIWATDIDGLEPRLASKSSNGNVSIEIYKDESGLVFNLAQGSTELMDFDDEQRLIGFTHKNGDKYAWDFESNVFTKTQINYNDDNMLYSIDFKEVVIEGQRNTSQQTFRQKYLYWIEEGYLEGGDNPTNQRSPTAKETSDALRGGGEALQMAGVCLTCIAPEFGIPMYKLGGYLEMTGDAIELGHNLVNNNYKEATVQFIGGAASHFGGNLAVDAIKKNGGDKIEQFAADALIDQSVKKATSNTNKNDNP